MELTEKIYIEIVKTAQEKTIKAMPSSTLADYANLETPAQTKIEAKAYTANSYRNKSQTKSLSTSAFLAKMVKDTYEKNPNPDLYERM